jgi:hypothetical protein
MELEMSSRTTAALLAAYTLQPLSIVYVQESAPLQLKTGTFSSMSVSERTGDIAGMELFVVPGANGHVVIAQGTEGAPGTPVVLPSTVSGAVVEFVVPPSCPCALLEGRYRASLADDGLTLSRQGDSRTVFLPRGDSFWQGYWRR